MSNGENDDEKYSVSDVKITNDGLIQNSFKIPFPYLRMITVRSLSENKILKEFTVNLPKIDRSKRDENEDDPKNLYEFMEYHNGYLYIKINEKTPMRVYDVKYIFCMYINNIICFNLIIKKKVSKS